MDLRPVRWQFPADAGEWDDQWLVIDGTVDLGDRTWSFTDPCLLIGEAHDLTAWLRQVAAGRVGLSLSFIEPVLSLSAAACGDELVVRFSFTAEAAAPWPRENNPVELRVRPAQILAAADDWQRELDALPSRSFTSTE
ncbi:hypothetical protein [Actinoplanes sp. NPDC048796]|uniref:WapI family immunity protein n=1 Tax=unclassified Actinoplanes TaxID=2626549 RepID=UPI0033E653F0